jgi:hypothetical protein
MCAGLKAEIKASKDRVDDLEETLKSQCKTSARMMDLEKDYENAKQDLASKQGQMNLMSIVCSMIYIKEEKHNHHQTFAHQQVTWSPWKRPNENSKQSAEMQS